MFEKCSNCGVRVVKGRRDENGIFCSKECQIYYRQPGFCQTCMAATIEETAGSTTTINGIGTHFYFTRNRCYECSSAVQTKFFCFFFIPIIPLGKYRVKYMTPARYLSRKLNPRVPQL